MNITLGFSNEILVGHFEIDAVDQGMGVFSGRFLPAVGYASVRPTFQLWVESDANTMTGEPADEHKRRRFYESVEHLHLSVRSADGTVLPTLFVHIYDFSTDLGRERELLIDVAAAELESWLPYMQ